MSSKSNFGCLACEQQVQSGPGFCTVNFHYYRDLKLNEQQNGYLGSYLQAAAHLSCVEEFLEKGQRNAEDCVICNKRIGKLRSKISSKLAIYLYRKRGCYGIFSAHDSCLKKKVFQKNFAFVKLFW